jgi:hypothetical protein
MGLKDVLLEVDRMLTLIDTPRAYWCEDSCFIRPLDRTQMQAFKIPPFGYVHKHTPLASNPGGRLQDAKLRALPDRVWNDLFSSFSLSHTMSHRRDTRLLVPEGSRARRLSIVVGARCFPGGNLQEALHERNPILPHESLLDYGQ